MLDYLSCPGCHKALRNNPDHLGTVLLCPFCDQAFVVPESDLSAMAVESQDRKKLSSPPHSVRAVRPGGIVAISSVGICVSGIIFILAALLALSCMNSVVAPVTEGVREKSEEIFREALPTVPPPTTRSQKIMSTLVMVLFALIFLWISVGLLRRRKLARWVFMIFCWMTFAAYLGILIGVFIMPGRPIEWWTTLVFLPAVIYFGFTFLYLRRKNIKSWFLQTLPKRIG